MSEKMRFAPPEMESGERAGLETELKALKKTIEWAAEEARKAEGPGETLAAILKMQELRAQAAPLEADLRKMRVLEQTEGVEVGLRNEALKMAEQRTENAEAIRDIEEKVKKLSAELKEAEAALEGGSGLEILDALTAVDRIQAELGELELSARRLAIDNLALASDLHTLKERGITEEEIPFTAAEDKWFEGGKKRSDLWEMAAAERERTIDELEEEFFAKAA
jgi:hypothetical protein